MLRRTAVLRDQLNRWRGRLKACTTDEEAARLIGKRFETSSHTNDKALQRNLIAVVKSSEESLRGLGILGISSYSALLSVATKTRSLHLVDRLIADIEARMHPTPPLPLLVPDLHLLTTMLNAIRCGSPRSLQAVQIFIDRLRTGLGCKASGELPPAPAPQRMHLTEFHFSSMIKAYCKVVEWGPAADAEEARKRGAAVFREALRGVAQPGAGLFAAYVRILPSTAQIPGLVELMGQYGELPGVRFAESLIILCRTHGDLPSARIFYASAKENGLISPPMRRGMIKLLLSARDWASLDAFWASEFPSGCEGLDLVYRLLSFTLRGMVGEAEKLFREYVVDRRQPHLVRMWRIMMRAYIDHGMQQDVGELALAYVSLGLPEDRRLSDMFAKSTGGCDIRQLPRDPVHRPAFLAPRFSLAPEGFLPPSWLAELQGLE